MTKSHHLPDPSELSDLDPVALDDVSGGFKWDENSPRSTNVIDCRGPTCIGSDGKLDITATLRHKYGIGHENRPLPTGDSPAGGPRTPDQSTRPKKP